MPKKEFESKGHRVFISYANDENMKKADTGADLQAANMICSALEAENIPCWIAPRDISPGLEDRRIGRSEGRKVGRKKINFKFFSPIRKPVCCNYRSSTKRCTGRTGSRYG